jgi:hypothetical protein
VTSTVGFTVDVSEDVPDPAVWDEVVEASGAPLFYRADVLRAYQGNPLRATLGTYYLMVRCADRDRVDAVLPVYLVPPDDPLGSCSGLLPGFRPTGRPLLLSHVWHWYDSHLPARHLDVRLLSAIRAAIRALATECGAQAFGFMNVAAGSRFADLLAGTGCVVRPIDARYVLDLRGVRSLDDYLAGLRPSARQDLRRHARLARSAGYEVTGGVPGADDLAVVARLCQATAAKHGNPTWFDPDRLTSFALDLRAHIRLVTVRSAGRPVAASISFADGGRFHNWTAGTVPLAQLPFSPYLVLLQATIQAALDEGCSVLEGGRRNDSWKERLGLRRQPLVGCLTSTDRGGPA